MVGFSYSFLKYNISFKKAISSKDRVHRVIYLQFDKTSLKKKKTLAEKREKKSSSAVITDEQCWVQTFFLILSTEGLFFAFGFPVSRLAGRLT